MPSTRHCDCLRSTEPLSTPSPQLLEKGTLVRSELGHMLAGVAAESNSSETVGTPRVVEPVDQD